MTDPRAETDDPGRVPLRLELAIYGAATFSNSLGYMVMVAVPLLLVSLGLSPLMVGIVLGSRHLLVLFYSIHGGAMMDRLDTRRVMILFAWLTVVLPLAYPLFPFVAALIIIQMAAGYCTSIGWIGALALIGQALKSSPVHTGRMGAVIRIGALTGPPLTGAAWDVAGPWASFGLLSLWGAGLLLSCLALPDRAVEGPRPRVTMKDFMPRASDYAAALGLLTIPLIATVIMVALLRISSFSIQASFYVVWLEGQGYTGTLIGVLLGAYSLFGGGASLAVGRLVKRFQPVWLMIVMVAITVVAITVTPALGAYWALLLVVSVNGAAYGLTQPLMIIL
ncbi:MAG TPA: MFS transporter, partial [Alphaproteobacteria bacterium]|nr:MFS transporter [Alphaproteobacteria bacterium]